MQSVVFFVMVSCCTAQWCNVDSLSRVTCLFKDESQCISFGCCWDSDNSTLPCFDPGNGCHGAAITPGLLSKLVGNSNSAKLGQSSFVAQTRKCNNTAGMWTGCGGEKDWKDNSVEIRLGLSSESCVSYNCPAFAPAIQMIDLNQFNVSLTNPNITLGENGAQSGVLDIKTGLVSPFEIQMSILGSNSNSTFMQISVGYISNNCIHFQTDIQNFYLKSTDEYYQTSLSLRASFA